MKYIRRALVIIESLIGFCAVAGGLNLAFLGIPKIPVEWLSNSPFSSFLVPGLILSVVVGGTNLTAAWLTSHRNKFAGEASATAGFGLLIWVFAETLMVGHYLKLQVMFFSIAVVILVLTMFLVRFTARQDGASPQA